METKRISIIALAVFMLSVLILNDNIEYAYAISHIDVTLAGNQNYSDLVDRNTATGDPCRLFTLTTIQKINVVNCDNHTVITSNGTLGTTGTSCTNNGVQAGCNLGTGTFSGLECNRLVCFISFSNATSNIIVRYTHPLGFSSITGWHSQGGGSVIEPDAIESFVADPLGSSITVWYALQCSGADTDRVIRQLDGASMILLGQVDGATTCATASGTGGNLGAVNVNDIKFVSKGVNPSVTNHIAVTTNGATNNFRLFNIGVNSFTCQFSGVTSNQLAYHNTLTEFYLIANAVSGDVVRIENDASCTNNGTITDVTLGTTGFSLRRGDVNEARGEIYVSDSTSKVVTLNNTYSKVWTYELIGDIVGLFAIETNSTEVAGVSSINKARFVIIEAGALPPTGDPLLDEFCAIEGNQDLLACFEPEALVGASELVSDSIFDLLVSAGLITGTDTNCKTNGVGYGITAVALGIFVGLLWVASRGQLLDVPTFIWVLGAISIVAMITAFNCLEPQYLIITIIVIIALATAKTRNIAGGQSVFAGEGS